MWKDIPLCELRLDHIKNNVSSPNVFARLDSLVNQAEKLFGWKRFIIIFDNTQYIIYIHKYTPNYQVTYSKMKAQKTKNGKGWQHISAFRNGQFVCFRKSEN